MLWTKHQTDRVVDAWFNYLDNKTPENLRDVMWQTWKAFVMGVPYNVYTGLVCRALGPTYPLRRNLLVDSIGGAFVFFPNDDGRPVLAG